MISNFQCRALCFCFDPYQIGEALSESELTAFRMEKRIECQEFAWSDSQLFEEARKRLDGFFFVGITERFAHSIAQLSRLTGWTLDYAELNKANDRVLVNTLAEDLKEQLRSANQADYMLYDYANGRLDELLTYDRVKHLGPVSETVQI